jgi:starch phosphorylase
MVRELLTKPVEDVEYLAEMALDLRNCWEHGTDEIWQSLDPELWSLTHNPWLIPGASRTTLSTNFNQRPSASTAPPLP